MTGSATPASSTMGAPRAIFALTLVAIIALPSLPFFDPPHLFSPVDKAFLHWYVGIAATLGYLAFFGFFMWGNWSVANAGLGIIIGILSGLIAGVCGMMAAVSAGGIYGYYQLVHLPHETRDRLYAVSSISTRGRGGYHAVVSPYGFRAWGLPLSTADYRGVRAGTLTPPNLCYRVTELRRGAIVGIVEPSEWSTPDALVRCRDADPRRVDGDTPRPQ